MRVDRLPDVFSCDLLVLRTLWETRVKKYRQKQRKEQDRLKKSALQKINQQWQYRIACKTMKAEEITDLQHYLQRSSAGVQPFPGLSVTADAENEDKKFIFQLDGAKWRELPDYVHDMTFLKEWHIHRTNIQKIPEYIAQFQDLCVLEIPKNQIRELPVEIGQLRKLKDLNVNFNKLVRIPPELGECENLEKLQLAGNPNLSELPFELSRLKKLQHLDISDNKFGTIPICVLRMSSLQLLDISNNLLKDLPEDIDRLQELKTFFLHKNKLVYLPRPLVNISALKMLVVSGDELTCYPSLLTESPDIKFIKLYDNPKFKKVKDEIEKPLPEDHEKEFMEAYIDTLLQRETAPTYTTKVSLSVHL